MFSFSKMYHHQIKLDLLFLPLSPSFFFFALRCDDRNASENTSFFRYLHENAHNIIIILIKNWCFFFSFPPCRSNISSLLFHLNATRLACSVLKSNAGETSNAQARRASLTSERCNWRAPNSLSLFLFLPVSHFSFMRWHHLETNHPPSDTHWELRQLALDTRTSDPWQVYTLKKSHQEQVSLLLMRCVFRTRSSFRQKIRAEYTFSWRVLYHTDWISW